MNSLEDRLREALAERAELSPVDPTAWHKAVARSRRRWRRWPRPAMTGPLIPLAAAAAVVAVIMAATTLAGQKGKAGPGNTSTSLPGDTAQLVRQIPPVTPFIRIDRFADAHEVSDYLWFGYVPGHTAAGIALCQLNRGGVYDGYEGCTSGSLPAGALARSAATDGSGWIRLGVAAPRVTSAAALLPDGKTVAGVVESVPGIGYKVWAVSFNVTSAATVVFRDAAGHEVTHLGMPGDQPAPSRPNHGGLALFRDGSGGSGGSDMITAYRISGGRIGFWAGDNSMWSDIPVSQPALSAFETGLSPDYWFGYAPSGTARVALRLADGRQFTSRTVPGWPGSGIVFWGPLTLPTRFTMPDDMVVTCYDAAGRILREVPLIFVG